MVDGWINNFKCRTDKACLVSISHKNFQIYNTGYLRKH